MRGAGWADWREVLFAQFMRCDLIRADALSQAVMDVLRQEGAS